MVAAGDLPALHTSLSFISLSDLLQVHTYVTAWYFFSPLKLIGFSNNASICHIGPLSVSYHKMRWMRCFKECAGSGFVKRSARFSVVCTLAICSTPAATASRTRWYAIELCFFFKVEVGTVELVITDLLSQKTLAAPSIAMPNILSL